MGQEHQGKANGFMGMVIPVGHIFSPLIAMPLYMASPQYPYLLGFIIMFCSFIFIQLNKRHKWIRNKGYKRVELERTQSLEEA